MSQSTTPQHVRKVGLELHDLAVSIADIEAALKTDLNDKDREVQEAALADKRAKHQTIAEEYRDLFDTVERLASRADSPASFYDKDGNPLTGDASNIQATIIDKIVSVAPSNPDAIKEIERLLAHTTAKRIAEEMDVATYHAAASRLFDRLRQEARDAKKSISDEIKNIDRDESILATFQELNPVRDKYRIDALSLLSPEDFEKRCAIEADFLKKYRKFLEFSSEGYDRILRDFSHEATVEAYKDSTREVANRVEQEGVFAAWRPISAGIGTAIVVGLVIVLLSNNVVLKDWTFTIMLAVGLLVYGKSVGFGHDYRRDEIEALRSRVRRVLSGFFGEPAKTQSESSMIPQKNEPFKFTKLAWNSHQDFVAADFSAGDIRPEGGDSRLKRMRRRNLKWALGAVALAVLFAFVSGPGWNWLQDPPWSRSFAFVTRGPSQTLCTLTEGRVLFAFGDRDYIHRRDGGFSAIRKADLIDLSIDTARAPKPCPTELPRTEALTGSADPVVVVPLVVKHPDTAIQNVTPSTQASAFTTQIIVGGQVVSRSNVTVLPFFSGQPVTANSKLYGSGGIDQPEEAFFYGQQNLPEPMRIKAEGILKPIRDQLIGCAEQRLSSYRNAGLEGQPPKTRLRVEGYASESWRGVGTGGLTEDQRRNLNLYLAEGRRRTIIRMLNLNHPLIEIERAIAGSAALITAIPAKGSLAPESFQFPTSKALAVGLGDWLKGFPTDGNLSGVNAPYEVISRSAAILMVQNPPCGLSQ